MFSVFKRKNVPSSDFADALPRHIAVIMDGNGRWAKSRGLSRIAGHRQGLETAKKCVQLCLDRNIPTLSLFAFSSENWSRPEKEVKALSGLMHDALKTQALKFNENDVRLQILGDVSPFGTELLEMAEETERSTVNNKRLLLNIAVNYGGRWDILAAAKEMARAFKRGEVDLDEIDEGEFARFLSTKQIEDPDLLIRSSGEYRISNFMLWQLAYAEMYFTDVLWPDFGDEEFDRALASFAVRERRFGARSLGKEAC